MRPVHLNKQRDTVANQGRPIDIQFTGPLILSANPAEPVDAATKEYVDNRFTSLDANDLKTGILPIGRLPAFSGDVTNVAGSNVFTLNPSGVVPGTYRKVTVDSKGRVIGSTTLTASDIPPLNWSKVVKNKPNTLEGYGITDGVKLTGDNISGGLKSTATPTDNMHAVTRQYVEDVSSGSGGLVTPGIVISYPSTTSPTGYLRCNGGEVSKTTYAALYAVIGDEFGGDLVLGSGKPWKQQYGFNANQSSALGTWTQDGSLPSVVGSSQAFVTKNRVYLVGGYNGSAVLNTVYTASIDANGNIGPWSLAGNFPVAVMFPQIFVTKNCVFVVGGGNASVAFTYVYSAPINNDGTIGAWTQLTNLPGVSSWSQAVVTKGYVYLLGRWVGTYADGTVFRAPINTDGTLGTWATSTNLPTALYISQAIVTKNRVYLIGGRNSSSEIASVYTAPIDSNGVIGLWDAAGPLPVALGSSQVVVTNTTVYVLGGDNSSVTYYANINQDGTLGNWNVGTSLPESVGHSQVLITRNKIYLIGGIVGGSFSAKIYSTSFSGGVNDYSEYYNGNIAPVTNADNFRLPDYSSKETLAERFYIKY